MSLARVFCSWSIAAVLLLLSIAFSSSAESEKSLEPVGTADDNGSDIEVSNSTSNVTLTGNPQIDYVHDPNLPRELNGYNLSDYPFYSRVPASINFSCDGRKDGFYANTEHKCQIYHHCLFGSRYDFLCANYTAFDQRTFICQFVSDVDCPNSHMYFHRNKDLYVTKTTPAPAPPAYNIGIYERKRPPKRNKLRRPTEGDSEIDAQQPQEQSTSAPVADANGDYAPAPPPKRIPDADYADDDYSDEDDYRRPVRPRRRKCRYGRRRGRRCRRYRPRPQAYYSYREDYDDYDEDYEDYYDNDYDERGGRKKGTKRLKGGRNTIPAGTSQVTSTSSSETPAPTTTTTTEAPPPTSTSNESASGPLDSESVAVLQKQRGELLTKTRRPFVRPSSLRSRLNAKTSTTSTTTTSTTTTSTTTERAKPPTSPSTTSTTTEVPQYIYDYEYYEDDTSADASSSTTTTTVKPFLRGKLRGGNSAATAAATAVVEKQRVQPSIQVRVTEDAGTNTNTIRRRDNSNNVQTPIRAAALPSTAAPIPSTPKPAAPVTQAPVRPARFWQRKSTVKSSSAPTTSTTTTTAAPFYQDYEDYEDAAIPQSSAPPSAPPTSQSSSFQPLLTPTHQYGTSPAVSTLGQRQSYANPAPTAPQPLPVTTSRGHGNGNSLSSSNYARPNKNYAMQQYSQSSSSSSSNNNNDANYNTNSYHRQRNPPSSIAKPEFISLVDEDYSNPYVSPSVAPTSPTSTRLHGGGGGGGGVNTGYHQHPIRFFEQQPQHPFLFGAASEYNSPQFAFPPRNYPSPSNFQPYDHSNRRFSAHVF